MGWLSNAWGSIKHTAGSITHSLGHTVSKASPKILHVLSEAAHTVSKSAKSISGEALKDTKAIVSFGGKQIDKITDAETGLVGGIGGFLKNPLGPIAILGVAAVVGIGLVRA